MGLNVFSDINIEHGDKLASLQHALLNTTVFVIIIGKNYAKSPYLFNELTMAKTNRKSIIPIVLNDVDESSLPTEITEHLFIKPKTVGDEDIKSIVYTIYDHVVPRNLA